ncbi:MAG: ATP-binding protein [Anaerolineaceae bacterium]|nr:ATP-binding protein [Anaerolineaceae bacterium]
MYKKYPYIYTTDRTVINQAFQFDNQKGVTYKQLEGEHAIWAARVPFLPVMLSDELTRPGLNRIQIVQQRQFRFIYDLARIYEHQATFALRFISTPNPIFGQPNLIDIVFLGKVFSKRNGGAQSFAEQLWEKFSGVFPLEDPFGYPLEPVEKQSEFFQYYQPINFDHLRKENILEIRKYEDMPINSTTPTGRVARKGDYIAHPFVPSQSINPMSRFLVALASQPSTCYADISLRPTKMFDQEVFNVSFMIGNFKRTASEDDDITEEYIRSRSQIGVFVYDNLMTEREQLLMVRVEIVGEDRAPRDLAEALGSEMMGNAANKYPTSWVAAQPANDEQEKIAIKNIKYLEHDFWGVTLASPPLERLRYLATAQEAYGAFRLPIPPESGYLPGVLVRNEPFISPIDELEMREQARANLNDYSTELQDTIEEKKITLGSIYHRGTLTQEDFSISVRDLCRHTLIAGSTGSGKSTSIKHLISQLWLKHQIPFLVIYPVDKKDYRELRGFDHLKDNLLVYTLGDETTSPFRFNPFSLPKGVLLKTHISRLMRIFQAAFSLQDPLPMIYRQALRKVYREKGWDIARDKGGDHNEYPIMMDYYNAIQDITEGLQYSGEVRDNVRQASVIRIGDLLENLGHTINVNESFAIGKILNQPTIMELGRIGSTEDISLVMGFLLICLAEEVEINPRPKDQPHVTVIEEAHRLMSRHSSASGVQGDVTSGTGEDFGNLLAEVRAYGEAIVIAEQIPTDLVKGAIGNTFIKVMHWLEDAPSFDLFSSITNLNENQRLYARTLKPGFAIVRSMYGQPVHVKVPEFGDQEGFSPLDAIEFDDGFITQYMKRRNKQIGLNLDGDNVSQNINLDYSSSQSKAGEMKELYSWVLYSPMRTCLFCQGRETRTCDYKNITEQQIIQKEDFYGRLSVLFEEAINSPTAKESKTKIADIRKEIEKRFASIKVHELDGMLYCFLAHEAHRMEEEGGVDKKVLSRALTVLRLFK